MQIVPPQLYNWSRPSCYNFVVSSPLLFFKAWFPFTPFAYCWRYFSLEKNISVEKLISTFLEFQRKTVASENWSEARWFLFWEYTEVYLLLGLTKLWSGHFVKCFDPHEMSTWLKKEVNYLNFKCEQSWRYFFVRFYSFHHSAHVPCEKFRWRQAKSVSGNQA